MKILITGSTGFIGRRVTRALAASENTLYLLVRSSSMDKAKEIFSDLTNVKFIPGDITRNDVVDNVEDAEIIQSQIESVIHMAASYDLSADIKDAYTHNIIGTQNLLYLLKRMEKLKIFHYVSTYAVSGLHEGAFLEEQIETGAPFPDHYSSTKMQAELLVRNSEFKNVKVRIYRPCVIVGDSKTGEMDKTDGPYYFFPLFQELAKYTKSLPLTVLPISFHSTTIMPILPVDILTDWLKEMINNPTDHKVRSYHLCPEEKIFVSDLIHECAANFGINAKVQRIPFPKVFSTLLPYFKIPAQVGPYLQSKTRHSTANLKQDFPNIKAPPFRSYLPTLIKNFKSRL